jgi:hypothetical protein
MKFKIDIHNQLHIELPSNETRGPEVIVLHSEQTERLAMLLLPVARKFLNERGVSTDL